MKYKTLFRLLLKFLGVTFLFEGVAGLLGGLIFLLLILPDIGRFGTSSGFGYPLAWITASIATIGFGLYLLLGAEGLVNRVIPSNHPYCPECGYDLIGGVTDTCPECGLAIPSRAI